METIRKIVDSSELSSVIDLPESMQLGRVEIIVMPLLAEKHSKKGVKSMKGILKNFANPNLIMQEKGVWGKMVAVRWY